MRTSVERLRIGLLVGAGLLVLVIAAFLGYARYKVHRALVNLPGKLGATITKEFNGYTYSQSDGKRTIFTLHAAKAVQHKDGNYGLHDVNMVLYGKKGDRTDRISGDDFEYDTKSEVIRAIGVVHIDLQAPEAAGANTSETAKHLAGASTVHDDAVSSSRVIHVKTSGLVYLKTLGIAATKEGIEFAFGGFTGHAIGAEYNSDTGHVILQSAITVSGLDKGHPIALAASHGELDRVSELADFDNARYSSGGQIAQADLAHIHMRSDGNVERIEGERHVTLEEAGQGSVTSDRADVSLDNTSKPKAAILTGNVHFVDDEPLRQAHGDSDRANLAFDAQGHLNHAVLQGRVHATERLRGPSEGSQAWSQRDLTSDTLDVALVAADPKTKPQLRDVKATGSARMTSVAPNSKSSGINTTKLSGDTLTAHFIAKNGTTELSTVHGTGHTLIEQLAATGPGQITDQTSTGSTLDAEFRASAKGKGAVELATAVQQGEVVITRTLPAKKTASAPEVQHATASKAAYDAETDRLTLTGSVQMSDATSAVSASRVVLEQDSGNATADGSVKVSYSQSGSAEPVHVLAARADLNHDAARATFYGSAVNGVPGLARMWQPGANGNGGSQIEAPILVFEQEQKRLTARAEAPGTPGTVHAVLADTSSAKPASGSSKPASKDTMKPLRQGVARITSSQMVYSDLDRQAEFTGGVKLLDSTGEMHAQQATVYLAPASTSKPRKPQAPNAASGLTGLFGGSVERIVATQHIEITQPGRKATGERLVYTASDQMFVLTGTASAPPKVVDATQGTTTGAALRFHSGDDSVVISGRDGDAPTQKVHTETRVKQ
jgi:lipopolysaccharide export system protein LptA